jgi:hypothetical protein
MRERVAVITDLHANLPALQATLVAVDAQDVKALYAAATSLATGRSRTRSVR